jgi:hypothetical protein
LTCIVVAVGMLQRALRCRIGSARIAPLHLQGPALVLKARPARAMTAFASLGSAAVGALLAWHYPIAPAVAVALFVTWVAANCRWPFVWLVVIPALLPISGFATWTGWFAFEELDLLVLGAVAAGYARFVPEGTRRRRTI